jgi:hypothetical protein
VKQIRKRLTYANVMSSIAVFLVFGGAAFAAAQLPKNSVGTKQLKKNAVATAKIKNNAVTGAKANEATFGVVPNATHATSADKATAADKATNATKADSATTAGSADTANFANGAGSAQPEVFAKIEGNGSVVGSLSKGLSSANVTHPAAGTYCITVPAFEPRGAVANVQFGGTYTAVAQVTIGGTGFCPEPTVQVITSSSGTPNDFTFYIVLYH